MQASLIQTKFGADACDVSAFKVCFPTMLDLCYSQNYD